ncbi:hypothetical protein GCM10009838_20680 [Catenulispora subtropica]|uniref:Uncharacterized protein n=1 Tax=Catenulispora subtropica TaxID=450798 RepID=A0ABP5CG47_9ACTN
MSSLSRSERRRLRRTEIGLPSFRRAAAGSGRPQGQPLPGRVPDKYLIENTLTAWADEVVEHLFSTVRVSHETP